MAYFQEIAANGVLVDVLIFAFPASAMPTAQTVTPQILELEFAGDASGDLQLYLTPNGALRAQDQIFIVNETAVQWAGRGCQRVPRVPGTGVPWELRATRAAAVANSNIRFWWEPVA